MDKSRSKLKTKTVIVEINMVEGKYELKIFMLYDINEKNMYLVCTVYKWLKEAKNNNDTVNSRGNGNYSIEDKQKLNGKGIAMLEALYMLSSYSVR